MSRHPLSRIPIVAFLVLSGAVYGANRDDEITAFADKAIAHILEVGREQAYKDFGDRDGDFIQGEVYVAVLSLDGTALFNPINPRLIGKNFLNFTDTDGRLFIQEIIAGLQRDGVTWIEYNWVNPVTERVAKKRAIARMIDDTDYVLIGYWP